MNAGSSDFAQANTFADSAPQLDSVFKDLKPAEAFDIVLRVCKAANSNAFSAINLCDRRFSSTPLLASLAAKHISEDPTAAEQKLQEKLSVSASQFVQKYLEPKPATSASQ